MARYKFIINPIPLKDSHRIFLENLKQKLDDKKIDFSYEYTTKEKSAEQVAKGADFDVIVASGGDGTIREVLNGIYGSKKILAVLPLGTSNDFAKHLGIEKLGEAENILFNGIRKKIDIGSVEYTSNGKKKKTLFCSTSGIGFDARMLKLNCKNPFIKLKRIIGNLIYVIAGFFLAFFYKSNEAVLEIGNKRLKMDLFMLNANFIKSMSGMKVTPNAGLYNNRFDIFLIKETSVLKKIIGFLWYAITSKKLGFRQVQHISKKKIGENEYGLNNVREFSVKSKNPIEVQINGDFVGYTPVKFKLIPKAVEILT